MFEQQQQQPQSIFLIVHNVNASANSSPGSSVFDLPITSTRDAHAGSSPQPLPPPTYTTSNALTSFTVISGGTGGNAICSAFGNACYVLPVSDDGGSSSEIIRVLGGPSIGDIRSRLIRLIPSGSSSLEAIRAFLAYRLPAHYTEREAREAWRDIVEGTSSLWQGIPNDRKETIRGFLVHFESEVLKRAHKKFTFINGSIGNYFLAAAQGFFRSLPSAIFLFSSITNSQANILPVIVTNHTVTIAAELDNGEKLVGQCEISHPMSSQPDIAAAGAAWSPTAPPSRSHNNVMFEQKEGKSASYEPLASRISRLFYINAYGMEIHPSPNPDYLASLASNDVLVYSCGSLWTSIIPCLALRGVAAAIASSQSLRAKVFLLNAKNDRETHGYSAVDYILALTQTLNAHHRGHDHQGLLSGSAHTTYPISAFITDLIYLEGTSISVDVQKITALGVRCTQVKGEDSNPNSNSYPKFESISLRNAIDEILARGQESSMGGHSG